jgi:hypothetical protein
LQVTVIFTAGEERKRRRSWARRRQWRVEGTRRHCSSTVQAVLEVSLFNPWSFRPNAPHCSSTVHAVPEAFLCNSWSFRVYFVNFKLLM